MKNKLFIISLLLICIVFASCRDESTNPPAQNTPSTGWAVGNVLNGYGYILKTTDSGNTWARQGDSTMLAGIQLSNLAVLDENTVWIAGTNGTIIISEDGGNTWQKQITPGDKASYSLLGFSAINRNTAYACGGPNTILRTLDGGNTWNDITTDSIESGVNLQGICAADADNIWVVGQGSNGNEGFIYKSTDTGTEWQRIIPVVQPPDTPYIGVKSLSVNDIWIHGGKGLFIHSTDGGINWVRLDFRDIGDFNDLCFYDNNNAFIACDYDIILHSTNGGVNWEHQSSPPPSNQFLVGVSMLSPTTAYIVGTNASFLNTGKIVYTTDGGATWQLRMQTDTKMWKIAFAR